MLSLVRAMAAEARAAPAVHEDEHDGQSLSDANMSADEFRAMHDMRVFDDAGGTPPDPIRTFEEAGFPEQLMKMVKNAGFDKPTHVQSQAWPIATSGRDLIAIANTGSGKTAGYLVPALAHIREATRKAVAAASATGARPSTAAFVLIVAPTRELARQIQQEALKFGAPLGLRTACLYGGSSRGPQTTELFRHPHIIIGTPGRLIDFAESGELDLSRVSYLVLDEADRMLDMGFEPQLAKLSRYLARERQTLFFSATWPPAVQSIAERFACNRPVKLFVGNVSDRAVAATTIKQLFEVVETPGEKVQVLADYLASKPRNCKVLVFVARKARCEWLHHALSPASGSNLALRSVVLHGDLSQKARDLAVDNFKRGRAQLLIATDVASRGLDIADVTAVVNFDVPNDPEDYVHRIGRTGRAGASGESLTLVLPSEGQLARGLIKVAREAGQEPPAALVELASNAKGEAPSRGQQWGRGGGGGGRGGGYGGRDGGSYGHQRGSYGRDRAGFQPHPRGGEGGYARRGPGGGGGDQWSDEGKQPHYGRTRMSGEFGGRAGSSSSRHWNE